MLDMIQDKLLKINSMSYNDEEIHNEIRMKKARGKIQKNHIWC
jgi:hypothetical protein